MNVVRIYTGPDGESHFEEVPLSFTEANNMRTRLQTAKSVLFRHTPAGYFRDFHTAPRRQYVFYLRGGVEIGVGDGSTRRMEPGDVLQAEDTTGRGHTSSALDGQEGYSAIVALED